MYIAERRGGLKVVRSLNAICDTDWITLLITTTVFASSLLAQPAARHGRGFGARGQQEVSPKVLQNRSIAFRILSPNADAVRFAGSDIPGNCRGKETTKGTNGVWEVPVGPIEPGRYRYNFNVVFKETEGGHTWINWRNFLIEFAPLLFK